MKTTLIDQIEKARAGQLTTIPFVHKTLNKYIFLGKHLYHLIGGAGGSGKSAWVDQNYVLNPISWVRQFGQQENIRIKIVLRSLERSKELRKAKWVCQFMYQRYGILIDTASMLSWGENKSRVTDEVFELIKATYDDVTALEEYVQILDGAENPTGIFYQLRNLALEDGKLYRYEEYNGKQELFEYHKKIKKKVHPNVCPEAGVYQPHYVPDDPQQVTLFIIDHLQALKKESGYTDKQNLDKLSEYAKILRDLYGMSPIIVNQLNRNVNDVYRRKNTDLLPEESDFSGSSSMFYDCDMAGILFNPYKYNLKSLLDWDIRALVNENNINRFRSFHLLKNTYGPDNQIFGYQFIGENGIFREMRPPDMMNSTLYENYRNPEFKQRITKHGN